MVEEITGIEQLNETLKTNETVLIDIWAQWCGPCKMIGPIVDEIAKEKTNVKVVKIDADTNKEIMTHFGIRSIPTLLYYKNNELKDKTVGATSKNKIVEKLESI